MPSVELLEKVIMATLGILLKTIIIAFPLSGLLIVMHIIFNDEFLSRHIFLTLILTALFAFTCFLLTLSKICILRKKSYAEKRNIDQLWDTDLKYENETEEAPFYEISYHCKDIGNTLKNLIFKNPFEFSKFRPAYGMFPATGFFFVCAFVAAFMNIKVKNNTDDFYCVAMELTFPMVILICLIYFISNWGVYIAEKEDDMYVPFEEFIQIPMKVFVGKTVAIFVTAGITHCLLMLFMFSIMTLSIISSNYLYRVSEMNDALKSLLPPIHPDPRRFMIAVLVTIIVSCINAFIGMILSSFYQAKKSILGVIEKNWQRNLGAISFLLPDIEVETLKDLKDALDNKRSQPLTAKELAAFNYISWPIWRTKQPFMLRSFDRDASEQPDVPDQVEPEHGQQPDHAAEPEQMEPADIDQPSEAAPREVMEPMQSGKLDEAAVLEESKLGEPSTSAASMNVRRQLTI